MSSYTPINKEGWHPVRIVTPEEAAALDPATVANGYDRPEGCLMEDPNHPAFLFWSQFGCSNPLHLPQMTTSTIAVPSVIRPGMYEENYPGISLDEDFIRGFIAKHSWRFAMSMPECPHWYVVRGKMEWKIEIFTDLPDRYELSDMMAQWFSLHNRYIDFEGYKYWTMGYVLGVTIIINRAKLEAPPRPFSESPQMFFAKPPTKPNDPILPPE